MQGRVRDELEKAGIDTKPGLWSRAVLSNPRLPDLMSTTRERYLDSPVMTLETGTTMTPEGRRASDLFNRLPSGPGAPSWADKARYKLERVQRNSMQALATTGGGKFPSVLGRMVSALTGVRATLPRVDTKAWGSYGGQVNPNMRVPMWAAQANGDRVTLSPQAIDTMLSGLGDAFYQEAVPASRFSTISASAPKPAATHSVFLHEEGRAQTPLDQIARFGELVGLPINVARGPNGTLIDVNFFARRDGFARG